jgi:peptidoglycan hydrolase-like protein with peptidoglycan-binding domain
MSPHNYVFAPVRWRRALRRIRGRALALAVIALASMTVVSGVAVAATSSAQQGKRSSTLRMGMSGPSVKKLQRKLHVQATGYYGSQTKAAVKRFQRRNGLKADGVAGPATLRALGVTASSAGYETGGASPSSGGSRSSSGGSGGSSHMPAVLKKIAKCESGNNPRAISPSGRYRGKYQFDQATWEAWGGKGDPAKASEKTQDRIALKLYRARGTEPWPNCA